MLLYILSTHTCVPHYRKSHAIYRENNDLWLTGEWPRAGAASGGVRGTPCCRKLYPTVYQFVCANQHDPLAKTKQIQWNARMPLSSFYARVRDAAAAQYGYFHTHYICLIIKVSANGCRKTPLHFRTCKNIQITVYIGWLSNLLNAEHGSSADRDTCWRVYSVRLIGKQPVCVWWWWMLSTR